MQLTSDCQLAHGWLVQLQLRGHTASEVGEALAHGAPLQRVV